jgi:hypothetical protein
VKEARAFPHSSRKGHASTGASLRTSIGTSPQHALVCVGLTSFLCQRVATWCSGVDLPSEDAEEGVPVAEVPDVQQDPEHDDL